jgi:prolyl-tRNA synthetase
MSKKNMKGISVKKDEDFSQWYTELIQKAELDLIELGLA